MQRLFRHVKLAQWLSCYVGYCMHLHICIVVLDKTATPVYTAADARQVGKDGLNSSMR